ncbi:MAG: hypothetical protein KDD64_16130 [Bdellovibrionales bacterium]|nr:hypothetical protein [Bdellovibrionales bacterium]
MTEIVLPKEVPTEPGTTVTSVRHLFPRSYTIETIYENKRHILFRGSHEKGGSSLILKVWKRQKSRSQFSELLLSLHFLARHYEQNYQDGTSWLQSAGFNAPTVIQTGYIRYDHSYFVNPFVLMDEVRPARSLDRLMKSSGPGKGFLEDSAFQLIRRIHRAGISHGDLAFNNILYRPHPGGRTWNPFQSEWFDLVIVDCDKTCVIRAFLPLTRLLRAMRCLVRIDSSRDPQSLLQLYFSDEEISPALLWILSRWLTILRSFDRGWLRSAKKQLTSQRFSGKSALTRIIHE